MSSLYVQLCKELAWEGSMVEHPHRRDPSFPQAVTISFISACIGRDHVFHANGLVHFLETYIPSEDKEEDEDNSAWSRCDYKVMSYSEYSADSERFPALAKIPNDDDDKLFVLLPPHFDLSFELHQLYNSLIPDAGTEQRRQAVLEKITSMLDTSWPGAGLKIELFGSSAGGLSFSSSDLDLSIVVPSERLDHDIFTGEDLYHAPDSFYNMDVIATKLASIGMSDVRPIKKASVPICKFVDPESMLRCDISTHNALAIKNTQMIKYYTSLDPRIRPFLYALKYFSKERVINDSYRGTLTSYAYTLMALFYLTTLDPPVLPNLQKLTKGQPKHRAACQCEKQIYQTIISRMSDGHEDSSYYWVTKHNVAYHDCVRMVYPEDESRDLPQSGEVPWSCDNTQNVAELLLGFFRYFGKEFNFGMFVVTVKHGLNRFKEHDWRRSAFAVQDPFIDKRNVAYTCTLMGARLVKREFGRAYAMLSKGSTFAKVCAKPDLEKRPYDPDTVEQKYREHDGPFHQQEATNPAAKQAVQATELAKEYAESVALAMKMAKDMTLIQEERNEDERENTSQPSTAHSTMRQDNGTTRTFTNQDSRTERKSTDPTPTNDVPLLYNNTMTLSDESSEDTDSESLLIALRNVPSHVDRLDILDMLDLYGQVVGITQDKSSLETVNTYIPLNDWTVELILYAEHTRLPEKLELANELVNVTPLIKVSPR